MLAYRAALAAFAILAAGVTPIAPASRAKADSNPAIALCRSVLLPGRPASNLGECLSYINVAQNQSGGQAAHQCDFLEENDPFTFEMMFVSRSECIQAFGGRGRLN